MPHHQFSIITQKFPGGPFIFREISRISSRVIKFQEISRISRSCRYPDLNSGLRPKLSRLVSDFGLNERLIQKLKWPTDRHWSRLLKSVVHENTQTTVKLNHHSYDNILHCEAKHPYCTTLFTFGIKYKHSQTRKTIKHTQNIIMHAH